MITNQNNAKILKQQIITHMYNNKNFSFFS